MGRRASLGRRAVAVAVVGAALLWGCAPNNHNLLQRGEQAAATIVEVKRSFRFSPGPRPPLLELRLLVEPRDRRPFYAVAIQHVGHHELPRAEAGNEVIVRFRPSRPDRAVVESFTPHALPPRSVEEAQRLVDQAQALKQELNQPGGGEAASGIILSSRPTGIVVDHRALVVELRVKVLPAHGAPFDAWLVGLVRKGHVDTFAPGREVHLLFDPEDRARVHFGDTSRTSSCVEGAARTPCYDG